MQISWRAIQFNIKRGVSLSVDTLGNLKHETRSYLFWEDVTTSRQMDRNYMINFSKVRMFFSQRVPLKHYKTILSISLLFFVSHVKRNSAQ